MHTADLLKQACDTARRLGYQLRYDRLDGEGGICTVRGQQFIFIDLQASTADQLALVVEAIQQHRDWQQAKIEPELHQLLARHAA